MLGGARWAAAGSVCFGRAVDCDEDEGAGRGAEVGWVGFWTGDGELRLGEVGGCETFG